MRSLRIRGRVAVSTVASAAALLAAAPGAPASHQLVCGWNLSVSGTVGAHPIAHKVGWLWLTTPFPGAVSPWAMELRVGDRIYDTASGGLWMASSSGFQVSETQDVPVDLGTVFSPHVGRLVMTIDPALRGYSTNFNGFTYYGDALSAPRHMSLYGSAIVDHSASGRVLGAFNATAFDVGTHRPQHYQGTFEGFPRPGECPGDPHEEIGDAGDAGSSGPPPTPEDAATQTPSQGAQRRIVGVSVTDRGFRPSYVRISRRAGVRWRWVGRRRHALIGGPVRSDARRRGIYTKRFRRVGRFRVVCILHPKRLRMTVDVR